MFKWDFLYFCLCPLPLFLPLRITMKIHPSRVFTHKDLSETSHFWAEQSQLSQPLLLCQMLQTLNHFCGILLDPLQCAHLHWGAQIWIQQSSHISSGQTRGKGSPHRMCWHCSSQCIPAHCWLSLLQEHIANWCQLSAFQDPWGLFCRAILQ